MRPLAKKTLRRTDLGFHKLNLLKFIGIFANCF